MKRSPVEDVEPGLLQPETNFYSYCTECLMPIIILDLYDNIIKFKCVNKDKNNKHELEMAISDYIKKIKNKNHNIFRYCSKHHSIEYEYFCFDCKEHLCKKCVESREHINHIKYVLNGEIIPKDNEIKEFQNIIKETDKKIIE